ncbi:alpha/beta fold hydrolase [Nocardia sp. R7R-8]|uniref:alpha/beta fold hydrolase n=1 Tax=Nocardia sp. R7R-8 TaxID=3459304 RepID=UPI00403DA38C
MPALERPWGTCHYLDEGSGPLVVLLHPLAESGEIWRTVIDELAPRFRVVAPDARGHGSSRWDGAPFTIPELADDVAALIGHIGVGPARVAGLSMGGCTAIALAIRHPDRVCRLLLADTTADYGPEKESAWADRADKAVSVPRDQQLAFQVSRWFSPAFVDRDPAEVDRVSAIFVATDSRAHAAACRAMGAYSDADRLGEVVVPTRVLVGEDDYATPPAMAQELHKGIAGAELYVLPKVRHMSLIESAEARQLLSEHLG